MNRQAKAVLWKDWQEARRQTSLKFGLCLTVVLWLFNIALASKGIVGFLGRDALVMLIDSVASHQMITLYSIVIFMMIQTVYSKEIHAGSLEALLATPVTVWDVWLGKSLCMFLGGSITSVLVASGIFVELNVMYASKYGIVLPSGPSVLFFFSVGPLISFALCGTIGLLHLNSKYYAVGSMVYMFLGMGYLFIVSRNINKVGITFKALSIYGIVAIALIAIMLFIAKGLTKEKVLLCRK
ncbi:hypothetical protein CSB20_03885 [bacterium DOLZORAL124_64_63]|nr:MAG: hypothetical protein CSB20_03885 [bacterium DOLZORAL124_64_63]